MILCCGEALIDMIPIVSDGGQAGFAPHAGGAVFNTAIALGRLGVAPGFLTGLSTDLFGQLLSDTLKESGVDATFSLLSDLPTTLAFVKLTNGHATYTFYDENTAGRSLTPVQLPDLPDQIDALYFGGISLISEPCADFYAALAARESGRRLIMLDPNIRVSFIRNEPRYRARLEAMIAHTDILKVSDEDLGWMVPGAQGIADKVAALSGPRVVIVTRGGDGALAFLDGQPPVEVPARRVTIVDTVGAGDTFNAGVLASLAGQGFLRKGNLAAIGTTELHSALSHGAAVAAVTVSRAGANPPWAHELT
jgi:fructokinase